MNYSELAHFSGRHLEQALQTRESNNLNMDNVSCCTEGKAIQQTHGLHCTITKLDNKLDGYLFNYARQEKSLVSYPSINNFLPY